MGARVRAAQEGRGRRCQGWVSSESEARATWKSAADRHLLFECLDRADALRLPPHAALEREKQELGDATARLGTIEERKRALTRQLEGIRVDIDEWSSKLRDRQEGAFYSPVVVPPPHCRQRPH